MYSHRSTNEFLDTDSDSDDGIHSQFIQADSEITPRTSKLLASIPKRLTEKPHPKPTPLQQSKQATQKLAALLEQSTIFIENEDQNEGQINDPERENHAGVEHTLITQPKVMHFGGFEIGKRSTLILQLVNKSNSPQRFNIISPLTPFFNIRYTKEAVFVPGLPVSIKVDFTPTEHRYYYDCIRIISSTDSLLVPIHAYPVVNKVLMPTKLDFGVVPLTQTIEKTIPLRSKVPIDFDFHFEWTKPDPAFTVSPTSGTIPASSTISITLSYTPSSLITSAAELTLHVSQFNFKPIITRLTGSSSPGLTKSAILQSLEPEFGNLTEPSHALTLGSKPGRGTLKSKSSAQRIGSGGGDPVTNALIAAHRQSLKNSSKKRGRRTQSKPYPPPPNTRRETIEKEQDWEVGPFKQDDNNSDDDDNNNNNNNNNNNEEQGFQSLLPASRFGDTTTRTNSSSRINSASSALSKGSKGQSFKTLESSPSSIRIVDGIKIPTQPNGLASVHSVSRILAQTPGKKSVAEIKAIIAEKREAEAKVRKVSGNTISETGGGDGKEGLSVSLLYSDDLSTKSAAYRMAAREIVDYERSKDLKWFRCIGEPLPSPIIKSDILRAREERTERERLRKKRQMNRTQIIEDSKRVTSRSSAEMKAPSFNDQVLNNVWPVRARNREKFQRLARTVVVRLRAEKRLTQIAELIDNGGNLDYGDYSRVGGASTMRSMRTRTSMYSGLSTTKSKSSFGPRFPTITAHSIQNTSILTAKPTSSSSSSSPSSALTSKPTTVGLGLKKSNDLMEKIGEVEDLELNSFISDYTSALSSRLLIPSLDYLKPKVPLTYKQLGYKWQTFMTASAASSAPLAVSHLSLETPPLQRGANEEDPILEPHSRASAFVRDLELKPEVRAGAKRRPLPSKSSLEDERLLSTLEPSPVGLQYSQSVTATNNPALALHPSTFNPASIACIPFVKPDSAFLSTSSVYDLPIISNSWNKINASIIGKTYDRFESLESIPKLMIKSDPDDEMSDSDDDEAEEIKLEPPSLEKLCSTFYVPCLNDGWPTTTTSSSNEKSHSSKNANDKDDGSTNEKKKKSNDTIKFKAMGSTPFSGILVDEASASYPIDSPYVKALKIVSSQLGEVIEGQSFPKGKLKELKVKTSSKEKKGNNNNEKKKGREDTSKKKGSKKEINEKDNKDNKDKDNSSQLIDNIIGKEIWSNELVNIQLKSYIEGK